MPIPLRVLDADVSDVKYVGPDVWCLYLLPRGGVGAGVGVENGRWSSAVGCVVGRQAGAAWRTWCGSDDVAGTFARLVAVRQDGACLSLMPPLVPLASCQGVGAWGMLRAECLDHPRTASNPL